MDKVHACLYGGRMALGKNVKRLREARNWTFEYVGTAVGTDGQAIFNLEKRDSVRSKFAPALAELFEVDLAALLSENFTPQIYSPQAGTGAVLNQAIEKYAVAANKFREIPVIGKVMGGISERAWDDAGFPAGASDEYAEVASQDPNAFITPVEGNSMAPRYNPGEFALVEPNTEPEIEDDVMVRFKNDGTCLKRLLSRRGGFIRLGSYNTQDVITCRPEDIVWMYYVAHPVPSRKIKSRT
jgi:phage repressor protein C with HTH and peptisase S24 domain